MNANKYYNGMREYSKTYESPLVSRGASEHICWLWSDNYKFYMWRELWYQLAKAEMELGLPITQEQIDALYGARTAYINVDLAEKYERELHHDVMAHIKTLGDQVPCARGIIHLGATSQFIVDNTDSIRINGSLKDVVSKLTKLIVQIGEFAIKHKDVATLGLTHFQPAQPTTVGKRASTWAYDLYLVLEQLKTRTPKAAGVKGATGTQASFLELFDGDHSKVDALNNKILAAIGFSHDYAVIGQVYPRVDDAMTVCLLSAIAAACQKIATDIRLLAGKGELAEGFGEKQVGSSAMPYKRNPLYCERVCGWAKFLISMSGTALTIASEQWLERSLDDSSARRIVMPESFLTADAILNTMTQIFDRLVIDRNIISYNLHAEMPSMITERLLMLAAKNGHDRQEVHEQIRRCFISSGGDELIDQLDKLPGLGGIDVGRECSASLIGRAPEQVEYFYRNIILPLANIV